MILDSPAALRELKALSVKLTADDILINRSEHVVTKEGVLTRSHLLLYRRQMPGGSISGGFLDALCGLLRGTPDLEARLAIRSGGLLGVLRFF
jgi:hypothetical protein